jgi:tetratricopeptide (TPR) repeat protein
MPNSALEIMRKGFSHINEGQLLLILLILFSFFYIQTSMTAAPSLEEGKKLFKEEKFQEAKAVLEQVIKSDPRNHEAYFILGKIYYSEKNYDKSIENLEKAVELKDSVSEYHLWYGSSYLMKAQKSGKIKALFRAKKGVGELEKAVKLDSTDAEVRFSLFQYYLVAPGIAGGDKKKAEKEAKIIQGLDPFLGAQAWAAYWEREKDLIRAEEYLIEAVKFDTSSTFKAKYSLGYFYQVNKKYDKAITSFNEILTKKPEEMNALYQLGKTYILAQHNLEEAEDCFTKYLKVEPSENSPSWAAAHWRLGMVYDLQGEKELALQESKKALELEPDNKEFKKTLQELQKKK